MTGGGEGTAARDLRYGETGAPSSEAYRDILHAPTWATRTIIVVNVVAFAVMAAVFNVVDGFSPAQLAAWGANSGGLDQSGQWGRLIAYQFLHANLLHITTNMLVLWIVGRVTERLYGSVTFLFLYLAAGTIAGLVSVVWDPYTITVGASGPIFGVLGAFIMFLFRGRDEIPESVLLYFPVALLFAGLNLYLGAKQTGVDNAAHVGGLLTGLILGAVLTSSTDSRRRMVVLRGIVAVVVAVGLTVPPLWYLGAFEHRKSAVQEFVDSHGWYIRGAAINLQRWQNLALQTTSGAISQDEVRKRVQNDILPFWVNASARLRAEANAQGAHVDTVLSAAADFAEARLQWARAVMATANNPTGPNALLALVKIRETNLAQARLDRLGLRSTDETLPRPLAHSPLVIELMSLFPAYAGQCVVLPDDGETDTQASAHDGPALRQAAGCEAQRMFMRGDYANLDAAMTRYSRSLSDLPDGSSHLEGMLAGLDDLFASGGMSMDEELRRAAEWRHAVPGSAEPELIESLMFRDWAYAARGHGGASTVSQQAQQLYMMRSEMAAAGLREVAPAARDNPLWYQLSLDVGRDQSVRADKLWFVFDQGASKFPNYMPLYRQMLTALMPRWSGSVGAVGALILGASTKAGHGKIEPAMYARLYLMYGYLEGGDYNVVAQANADPKIMKTGIAKLRQLYPHSDFVLNEAAHYYCSIDDPADYHAIEPLLAKHVSSEAWPDDLSVAACNKLRVT